MTNKKRPTLNDVMIRFSEVEAPENKRLLVCSGMGDDKVYSMLNFCKKGHIMLHEYKDRYKGDKFNTPEERMMCWVMSSPNKDTITEEELEKLLVNFDLQEDRDYVVATKDSYFVYEVNKEGYCEFRQINFPEPVGTKYVVLE